MPRLLNRRRTVVILALVAAAMSDPSRGLAWSALVLVLFGAINVLWPGTTARWTRTVAVAAVLGALLSDVGIQAAALVLLIVMWIPAFLLEWILGRDAPVPPARFGPRPRARLAAAAIIVASAVAAASYRWLLFEGLHQSAALFVGIPALLAVIVIYAANPQDATGVACKAVTVGLLVSLVFLAEGVLCVAMSAPLFYLVAIVVGKSIDRLRREDETRYSLRAAAPVAVIILMSLEGVHHSTSFARDESVTVTRLVAAPADVVGRALFERPRFERPLPALLRAGFPRPIAAAQERAQPGARWTIVFRGGEMRIDGHEPRIGDLTLELVDARPGLARWRAIGDDSHMPHYLAWQGATVRWSAQSPAATRVEWTLHYRRSLDPAWYFGPMERLAVRLAAGYLIDSVATP